MDVAAYVCVSATPAPVVEAPKPVPEPEPVKVEEAPKHKEGFFEQLLHGSHKHEEPKHVEPAPAPEPVKEPEVAKVEEPVVAAVEAAPAAVEPVVEVKAVRHMGFIYKQGQVVKNWNNRYFVLDDGSLTYFEKPLSEPPFGQNEKGKVPTLKGKSLKVEGDIVTLTGGDSRDIALKFIEAKEKDAWVAALNAHIALSNTR